MRAVTRFGLVRAAVAGAVAAAPGLKGPRAADAPLVGDWAFAAVTYAGQPCPVPDLTVTFTADGKVRRAGPDGAARAAGTYSVGRAAEPAEVDLTDPEGLLVSKAAQAVFKVQGDTLAICAVNGGAGRPAGFESTADNKALLVTFKRVRPGK